MSPKNKDEQMTLLLKISDQVSDQSKSISNLDKKVDLNVQKVQYELEKIHELDEHQNMLIDKHIEGVHTLKNMHQTHLAESEARFQSIEAPRKWFQTTKKIIVTLGAIAVAIYGILRLFAIV